MLRGEEAKSEPAPEKEDPTEIGASALKDALASGDKKKIAKAFKAMQLLCSSDSDD